MQTISRSTFTTVTTEGAILPADLLQRIADGRELEGLRPADYHLVPNERLNETISRSWNRLLGVWESFDEQRKALPEDDRGTTLTRERWLLILFQELGYGRLPFQGSLALDGQDDAGAVYPISHEYDRVPIHLVSLRQPLDRADHDRGESFRRSPHSLVQEFVNRSDHHLWGIVSNGLRLRVLRDNVSFTRAAYLEFDLEAMMAGELYADFSLLWLTVHQSRLEGAPESCWLEKWSQEAAEQGTRALESLSDGVQEAIAILGRGFLAHPGNVVLRRRLQSGELSTQDYYRQLLRLAYRLIFLFVAEDRNLLLVQDADAGTREQYFRFYSATRLRELAARRRSGPHPDLYRTLRLVMMLLREGYPALGLPALGSYLFSNRSTPDLDESEVANETLLDAVRALAFTVENRVLRPVDYKNLGAEELGSVYESLLELHPELSVAAATFDLKTAAGSERKKTGSYYTPTSLINSLLDTALEPVVADRLRGKKGREAEEALLDIKVVDPAAGSGHFLIAAANRLARHLARIRTGDEEPSPEAAREALRDVVRHCIHGVDINEMAVELCKVGLWLETLDPGKPLNFLEANIQHGNSLIGATPQLLAEGIPDAAFTPITGDDKAYCREWKNRNKANRSGQMDLLAVGSQPWQRLGNLAEALTQMEGMDNATLAGVQQQEDAYARLVRSLDYEYGKLWADAWCAAFVWIKKPESQGGFPYPITEQVFRRLEHSPHNEPQWLRDEIRRLAAEYQFFHWHLAFPHVFRPADPQSSSADPSSGFDVVLGNPPWERVKLQEKEWFAVHSLEIAEARNKAARTKLIKELQSDSRSLYDDFMAAKRRAEAESHFARNGGAYPLCGRGDINTYPLFAELSRQLVSPSGRAGMVLPTGIVTGDSTKVFTQHLLSEGSLISIYDFDNRGGIFSQVQGNVRFCLLTLSKSAHDSIEFAVKVTEARQLGNAETRYRLNLHEIWRINPNTLTCPMFNSAKDARIVKAIYNHIPALLLDGQVDKNPWGISFMRMFDMATDSDKFHTREELETGNWLLRANRFFKGENVFVPLYEAKLVFQFNHRASTFDGISEADRFKTHAGTNEVTVKSLQKPTFEVIPRYWVREEDVDAATDRPYLFGYRRAISSVADARSVVATALPKSGASDSLFLLLSTVEPAFTIVALAVLNSFVFDYVLREKATGGNLSYYIFKQLPFPEPETLYTTLAPDHSGPLLDWLLPRITELSYTSYSMKALPTQLGYLGPPMMWDEERRFLIRCELDSAIFALYGLEHDDAAHILDTFDIVRRRNKEKFGEYRTKRMILEIYDEMADAERTGRPYQTRLNPPPAHPDAAHPWDEHYLGPELPKDQWWQEAEPDRPPERRQLSDATASPRTTTTVKEPAPALELKSPPAKQPQRETPVPSRPAQPALVTEFTPLEGSRSQRLKQVMALGDRVKSNRQDATVIAQLVAALADSDESIRWLAGSALGLLGGATVIHTLAAFLAQAPAPAARDEAVKALQRIADNPREEEAVREMAKTLLRE